MRNKMGKKVLVVDDSNSMRQMITFTLSDDGFECVEAEDGINGLKIAKREKFDLIDQG